MLCWWYVRSQKAKRSAWIQGTAASVVAVCAAGFPLTGLNSGPCPMHPQSYCSGWAPLVLTSVLPPLTVLGINKT